MYTGGCKQTDVQNRRGGVTSAPTHPPARTHTRTHARNHAGTHAQFSSIDRLALSMQTIYTNSHAHAWFLSIYISEVDSLVDSRSPLRQHCVIFTQLENGSIGLLELCYLYTAPKLALLVFWQWLTVYYHRSSVVVQYRE